MNFDHSIAAVSTPPGVGGIAVIRLSGRDAFEIADKVWKGLALSGADSHTAHLGEILDSDGNTLDQAVATVFAAGKSFTGEPTVEFSVHGSRWIQQQVVNRLIEAGAKAASAGEFTQRAFVNGRLDLAQAEGVADMIAASSKAAQRLAASQMKGKFSVELNSLRDQLVEIASLLELELDFSEEDVEFADRSHLISLVDATDEAVRRLAGSFHTGRAIKDGVNVVIAGQPNSGKSTLLNLLLQDEKAIVSDIAGTTRDIIEDTIEINGILFRFVDTAGLRDTDDHVEKIGVDRARDRIAKADVILWVIDMADSGTIDSQIEEFTSTTNNLSIPKILLLNKSDITDANQSAAHASNPNCGPDSNRGIEVDSNSNCGNAKDVNCDFESEPSEIWQRIPSDTLTLKISAKTGIGIPKLIEALTEIATAGLNPEQDIIVTNARHYEALTRTAEALARVKEALSSTLPADLIAQDLREATHHLGTITGAITPTDLLHTIFSRFCIGK